uniref:Transferrin receptor protein 1 n=1 Tax=Labrus bergylta TaxID=56723 RepID=A0A3Q3G2T7_9LABR
VPHLISLILPGYLIGFLVHRKKDVAPICAASVLSFDKVVVPETALRFIFRKLFTVFLFVPFFSIYLILISCYSSEFSSTSHRAGSQGDEVLGNKVLTKFNEYGMKTWTDEHFVKVQDRPASGFNSFFQERDMILMLYISCLGCRIVCVLRHQHERQVMLIRAGRISLAEKVANAAKMNASAVLIYPDPSSYLKEGNTPLFGHVHMGSGDPYTPGFPSINHTQFPPVQSSGLPKILAQTIPTSMADGILKELGGDNVPNGWGLFGKLGGEGDIIKVDVGNVLTEKKISNVFGIIKGFVDPDRYVVIGAQRDAWGPGFAASTVGTSVLVELARSISDMVKNDGFKPRRSIVFVSWTAGNMGTLGYLSSLTVKYSKHGSQRLNVSSFAGQDRFKVAASPLMHSLIESTMREVRQKLEGFPLQPLQMNDAAYPFVAFSGIPSLSFRFNSDRDHYSFFGTALDTQDNLNTAAAGKVPELAEVATRFAGHMVLRLVHDHLLRFDLKKYNKIIKVQVAQINGKIMSVRRVTNASFKFTWLSSASASYGRASHDLMTDIQNSNLDDIEMCRIINDRIMAVERSFLSPYVSPSDNPFRHILLGSGAHTLKGLINHLDALRADNPDADADAFRNQFALATWTIQGCADSLAGNIWSLDNEI